MQLPHAAYLDDFVKLSTRQVKELINKHPGNTNEALYRGDETVARNMDPLAY